jgi:hypothetical protein
MKMLGCAQIKNADSWFHQNVLLSQNRSN